MCMVFTLHGQNLLWLIKEYDYKGVPQHIVKELAVGILEGLRFLHEKCEIIHTDLKPENVLLERDFYAEEEEEGGGGEGEGEGGEGEREGKGGEKVVEDNEEENESSKPMTIEDLNKIIADPGTSVDERKKLKKKLKKKKQKARKKEKKEMEGKEEVKRIEEEETAMIKAESEQLPQPPTMTTNSKDVSAVAVPPPPPPAASNPESNPKSSRILSNLLLLNFSPSPSTSPPNLALDQTLQKTTLSHLSTPTPLDSTLLFCSHLPLKTLVNLLGPHSKLTSINLSGFESSFDLNYVYTPVTGKKLKKKKFSTIKKIQEIFGGGDAGRVYELNYTGRGTGVILGMVERLLGVRFLVFEVEEVEGWCGEVFCVNGLVEGGGRKIVGVEVGGRGGVKVLHMRVKRFLGQEEGEGGEMPKAIVCGTCEPEEIEEVEDQLEGMSVGKEEKGGEGEGGKGEGGKKEGKTVPSAIVVDLGNACWTYRHFSEDIQTRQYRCPEVIVGAKYEQSADIWSLGCIIFELLTGDLLFDPKAGDNYDRDEDHLAMFQELLGKMPKKLALGGKYSKNYFSKKGELKHIMKLNFWPLDEVLVEKYSFTRQEAKVIAGFITPMLAFNPKKRATAREMLDHPWLAEAKKGGGGGGGEGGGGGDAQKDVDTSYEEEEEGDGTQIGEEGEELEA
ncbi:hypothetical protein TrST_g13939 [Triparma strigata]|nr:hypothetical protein TrST_g13939 [Triparma strigata]